MTSQTTSHITSRGPAPVERSTGAPVVVLGIGNTIMADDGIGLALLEQVQAQAPASPLVDFVDGRTGGMELLPVVQDARYLLVLDAVAGPVPGEVVSLSGDQVPRLLASKLSPHQVGLLDILAAARLLGTEPERIDVVGVVPETVDLCLGMTEAASRGVEQATPIALAVLAELVAAAEAVSA
ncbi:HyaD/HybD family hydrogenase maturation endopeptidase [Luteococcus sp. OSA5]|uniref:HyaD/HybD family hydrogenase maturation endopeptidase n=1 Tax=Luteococcus sp. OSA5 TaxID=3401630 RepID=UPI003B42F81A